MLPPMSVKRVGFVPGGDCPARGVSQMDGYVFIVFFGSLKKTAGCGFEN